jgi:hypothetical protein
MRNSSKIDTCPVLNPYLGHYLHLMIVNGDSVGIFQSHPDSDEEAAWNLFQRHTYKFCITHLYGYDF